MSLGDALILAVVQGLTEFLPVSSSGHLVLAGALLGVKPDENALYVILLHLGSAAAIAVAFWRDWVALFTRPGRALWGPLLVGTVPAAVLGVLFQSRIEALLTLPSLAASLLLVTGVLLLAAERVATGTHTVEGGGLVRPVAVGLAQAVAMLPGISRSGACLATGLFAGYDRLQAVRLAFLLGLPIICGAGAKKLLDLATSDDAPGSHLSWSVALVGCVVCAVVSFGAIRLLQAVARKRCLWVFAAWCGLVGAGGLIWLAAR